MDYKAVIFDLDGTLVDTIDDIADSMNSVLISLGFPSHDVEAYKQFVGEGLEQLVRKSLPEDHREELTVGLCIAGMRREYSNRSSKKSKPYQGIAELFDALVARKVKLAVLSNKFDEYTKEMICNYFPMYHFDAIFGERLSVPKKPDPAGAIEISQLLGLKPAQFIYVGDSGIDMMTAKRAGMYAVGVTWGFRSEHELLSHGAKMLINNPLDLICLF
ncbi:MAG: HAD family hydrolase [Candidatus Margulisbacteria bacterium GWE2_39_32]|nr:MAG: HAD family hydrolase [Candidatus Margulisbacteria bacterium GWE2_39_32]